jgi:hypothetical protein
MTFRAKPITPRLFLLAAPLMVALLAQTALAITPNDPKVRAMIEKGINYLETVEGLDSYGSTVGGQSLLAMAVFKHRKDASHPRVQQAIEACRAVAANPNQQFEADFNYSLGIAIIFLCEVDARQYENDIKTLLALLRSRQRPDGSWSYPNYSTGDTSQTQYGMLAMWMAAQKGIAPPQDSLAAVTNWLIRVQDPSGAMPYQGHDPGIGNYNRISQPEVRLTMSPAGLGSLYIAAHLMKVPMDDGPRNTEVLRKADEVTAAMSADGVDVSQLRRAIRDGNNFYQRNFRVQLNENFNQTYYLYSLERYQSFREEVERLEVKEPGWYNDGVDFLSRTQGENGSWTDNRGPIVGTAFASMFLMRATQATISLSGSQTGGFGLPDDPTNAKLVDGQVVTNDLTNDLASLMEKLESGEYLDTESLVAQLDHITLENKAQPPKPTEMDQLRQLVSTGNFQERRFAVRALSNSSDISMVPLLIYALGDGDWRVVKEANDGLRLISRRFSVPPLPEKPSAAQKRAAQEAWRDWLKSVRPDIVVPADAFVDTNS